MIWQLAWRNIWRNKIRSMVIMCSVALGLMAGLLVVGVFLGMVNGRVNTLIKEETGHLQIHHLHFKQDMEPAMVLPTIRTLDSILQRDRRINSYCFRSVAAGMLSTPSGTAGVQVNGIVPAKERLVTNFNAKVTEGQGFDITKKGQVVISKKLAKKLKLKKGLKLVLTFSDTAGTLVAAAFRVAALYQTANAPFDELNIYIRQEELNELLGTPGQSHELIIQVKEDRQLAEVKASYSSLSPLLLVETWQELSPETALMMNTIDVYSYLIIIIVLLALSFGIVNAMLMAVLERTHEIGMMTALGLNRWRLSLLVLTESILLTLWGTPVGILLAWLLIAYYQKAGIHWYRLSEDMMSRFGFSTTLYPEFPREQLFPMVCFVTATALLAGVYPVWRALRLDPVMALRK